MADTQPARPADDLVGATLSHSLAKGVLGIRPAATHRGWNVYRGQWPEPAWMATSPDYDASYEGEEDGWRDNGEKADGATYDELIVNIDEWFEENSQFGVGA